MMSTMNLDRGWTRATRDSNVSTRTRRYRGRIRQGLVQADEARHGAAVRYLGPLVPAQPLLREDPFRSGS